MTYKWKHPTLWGFGDCDPSVTISDERFEAYCERYGRKVIEAYYTPEGVAAEPAPEPEPTPDDEEG